MSALTWRRNLRSTLSALLRNTSIVLVKSAQITNRLRERCKTIRLMLVASKVTCLSLMMLPLTKPSIWMISWVVARAPPPRTLVGQQADLPRLVKVAYSI